MAGKWRYGYVTVVLFLAVFFAAGCKKESVSADVANSSINESEDSSAKEEKVKETSEESTESLELWYTREAMTPYLEAVLSDYEAKTGIKVNCVQKSGIDFVEEINEASVNPVSYTHLLPLKFRADICSHIRRLPVRKEQRSRLRIHPPHFLCIVLRLRIISVSYTHL